MIQEVKSERFVARDEAEYFAQLRAYAVDGWEPFEAEAIGDDWYVVRYRREQGKGRPTR